MQCDCERRRLSVRAAILSTISVCPSTAIKAAIDSPSATVVRHFEDGIGCEFFTHFSADEIDQAFRLR
jgi:hypothetical protein